MGDDGRGQRYANVIAPRPLRSLFTYSIPPDLIQTATLGKRVLIPFGSNKVIGLIAELTDTTTIKTKDVELVLDDEPVLPTNLLELALWTSRYYFAPPGDVLPLALPKDDLTLDTFVNITSDRELKTRSEGVMELFNILKVKGGSRKLKLLASDMGMTPTELKKLLSAKALKSFVETTQTGRFRQRRVGAPEEGSGIDTTPIKLTTEQAYIAEEVGSAVDSGGFEPFLLKGVTGSGKTEVYGDLARRALEQGKSTLVLAPEIEIVSLIAKRLRKRLGVEVSLLHSGMTPAQRSAVWDKTRLGGPRILVGARSAVFAPVANLGIVIIDEEHDSSYKESESPRYNGRDIAIKRASLEGVPVLLGSATPSLESYYNATTGKYRLLELKNRLDGKDLPTIRVCEPDMDVRVGGELKGEIEKRLESGEQSLLFLNRRGAARFIQCRRCGFVFECPNCSVSLVSHRAPIGLKCHICDYTQMAADTCPQCESNELMERGAGTQKVERELEELFPKARIARMDRDTTTKRGASSDILSAVESGKVDILVGTQMVTKGHDFPGITLVGALSVEDALYMPDFRSSERSFQQITQAAGRSGRGERPGEVILQAINSENHCVIAALENDYEGFVEQELEIRKAANFPPFSRLARVIIDCGSRQAGQTYVNRLTTMIHRLSSDPDQISIMGPAEAVVFKVKNRWRWRALLRAETAGKLARGLHVFMDGAETLARDCGGRVRLKVDVDPMDIM